MNIEQGAMQKALVLAGSVLAKGGDTSRGVPTPVSTPVPTLLSPGVNHRKDLGNQEGGAGDSFDSLGASRVWGVPTPVPGVSTVPTGLIDALGGWLGKSEILAELGKADTATRQLSDKEREQRRAAAKARWAKYRGQAATAGMAPVRIGGDEGRQLPGGPGRRMTSSLYGQYRAHKDAEFADVKPEGGRAGFKTFGFQPQRPKGMSEESYTQLATAAGRTVKGLREQIAAKAQERRLIPEGTTSRDYRAALSHAQRLALHDVGLGSYDFRMEDEAKGRMKPLEPFIRYARRRTYSALRDEHKGTWQQFKAEFGQEFADRRVDLEGNVRRRFYPHMELVRSEPSDLLSSEGSDLGKRVLTDKEREQRRAAAKARWGNQPRSDYSPKRQLLMQRYGMTESVANAVGGRFSGKSRLSVGAEAEGSLLQGLYAPGASGAAQGRNILGRGYDRTMNSFMGTVLTGTRRNSGRAHVARQLSDSRSPYSSPEHYGAGLPSAHGRRVAEKEIARHEVGHLLDLSTGRKPASRTGQFLDGMRRDSRRVMEGFLRQNPAYKAHTSVGAAVKPLGTKAAHVVKIVSETGAEAARAAMKSPAGQVSSALQDPKTIGNASRTMARIMLRRGIRLGKAEDADLLEDTQ